MELDSLFGRPVGPGQGFNAPCRLRNELELLRVHILSDVAQNGICLPFREISRPFPGLLLGELILADLDRRVAVEEGQRIEPVPAVPGIEYYVGGGADDDGILHRRDYRGDRYRIDLKGIAEHLSGIRNVELVIPHRAYPVLDDCHGVRIEDRSDLLQGRCVGLSGLSVRFVCLSG